MGPRQKKIQKKYITTIIIKLLIVFITLIIFIFAEINTANILHTRRHETVNLDIMVSKCLFCC